MKEFRPGQGTTPRVPPPEPGRRSPAGPLRLGRRARGGRLRGEAPALDVAEGDPPVPDVAEGDGCGEVLVAGAAVSGGVPTDVKTSTAVPAATTATRVLPTNTALRRARLCRTRRSASSRRSSARLRLTFRCDMDDSRDILGRHHKTRRITRR
jgi:hypothetical protein